MEEKEQGFENPLKKVSAEVLEKAFKKTITEVTGTKYKLDCSVEKIAFGPGWSQAEITIKIS